MICETHREYECFLRIFFPTEKNQLSSLLSVVALSLLQLHEAVMQRKALKHNKDGVAISPHEAINRILCMWTQKTTVHQDDAIRQNYRGTGPCFAVLQLNVVGSGAPTRAKSNSCELSSALFFFLIFLKKLLLLFIDCLQKHINITVSR